ncbi:hypothetical protein HC931_08055 [Candidatus Gracilibacteria bacterium]|jgi:hypothetical protein|nr:hypothetical protein [Candidatus Gracilibacteria bacterium]NJM87102.1 hypothetical protein [Hydrococcus sp. RU_2_2]NJP20444.1 hypothetical protein [Hydrococcus sp. CRU_1_1]
MKFQIRQAVTRDRAFLFDFRSQVQELARRLHENRSHGMLKMIKKLGKDE